MNYILSYAIQICKIYSLTLIPIKQLLLKDISTHITQLHVSANFYGAIFRLRFQKGIVYN